MRTVHLILNAHLDPVWLWPWSAGLGEIINTCSSVCDLLDRHPDLIFTRGEAWVYENMEIVSPDLFRRVQKHISSGQWEIVGGWYVQPDCNLPGKEGLEKQVTLGRAYFESRFGKMPEVAYNVDSFGHAASLPDLMCQHGQKYYVMMRPQEHEMSLPARLFRWQGTHGEVVTFRIAGEYCTPSGATLDHIEKCLTELPDGVNQTMCFVGVGDHGGGPTEQLIQWCKAHQDALPGAKLIFSSPARFFKAIQPQMDRLPVVSGELQQHAIGCYSVHRAVKRDLRKAERLLSEAERVLTQDKDLDVMRGAMVEQAWKWTCFNAFHDTLGGTCLPSAYETVASQLGFACATADEVLTLSLQKTISSLPPHQDQRIIAANFGELPFDDIIEHEPWLEWTPWDPAWELNDEEGRRVDYQLMEAEALRDEMARLAFRLNIPPGQTRILFISQGQPPPAYQTQFRASLSSELCLTSLVRLPLPTFILKEDLSDTWGHGLDRFSGPIVGRAEWTSLSPLEQGPLMEIWKSTGTVGQSLLSAEWRCYPGHAHFDLHLLVDWREQHKVLNLVFDLKEPVFWREDGIPGGILERKMDGRELPLRDFSKLILSGHRSAAIATPDVYSASGTDSALSLTLLRSSLLAHHEPHDGQVFRSVFSDQGTHVFRFRFFPPGHDVSQIKLEASAHALSFPIRTSDLTIGMPVRSHRGQWMPPKMQESQ